MRETKLYEKIKPHLLAWGECDRVENVIGSGMSDVFYNIDGVVGWIETKIAKGDYIYFEKFQPNWMAKHVRGGMERIFVFVLDRDENIRIYRASVVVRAPRSSYGKWVTVSMSDLGRPDYTMPSPYRSWRSVREILIS